MDVVRWRRSVTEAVGLHRLSPGILLRHSRSIDLDIVRLAGAERPAFLITDRAPGPLDVRMQRASLYNHLGHQLLADVLQDQNVNVVLDVGANRGQFGSLLRRLGYTGRIVSYEPVSRNVTRLKKVAAADPQWFVEGFALGETEETAEINVSAGPGKLSSLLQGSEFGQERFEKMRDDAIRTETISLKRLDSVYKRAVDGISEPRVFLKMDTQGYDLQAWAGAGTLVDQFVGLQSEVSSIPIYEGMPRLDEQYAIYEQAGFTAVGMTPVSRDLTSLAVIEFDLLMIRR